MDGKKMEFNLRLTVATKVLSFVYAPPKNSAEQAPTFKITIGAGYRYDPTAWNYTYKSDDLDNFEAKLIKDSLHRSYLHVK